MLCRFVIGVIEECSLFLFSFILLSLCTCTSYLTVLLHHLTGPHIAFQIGFIPLRDLKMEKGKPYTLLVLVYLV